MGEISLRRRFAGREGRAMIATRPAGTLADAHLRVLEEGDRVGDHVLAERPGARAAGQLVVRHGGSALRALGKTREDEGGVAQREGMRWPNFELFRQFLTYCPYRDTKKVPSTAFDSDNLLTSRLRTHSSTRRPRAHAGSQRRSFPAFEDEHHRERIARPSRVSRAPPRDATPPGPPRPPSRRRRGESHAARRPRRRARRPRDALCALCDARTIATRVEHRRARQRGPRPRRGARRVRHDLRHRALPGPRVQAGGVTGPRRLLLLRRPPLRRHPGLPGVEARPAHALRAAPHRRNRRRVRIRDHRTAPRDPQPRTRRRGRPLIARNGSHERRTRVRTRPQGRR